MPLDTEDGFPYLSHVAYRKPGAAPPEDDKSRGRAVVRMAEPPEDVERARQQARKQDLAELVRAEGRVVAEALDEERRRFDRQIRAAGAVLFVVSIGLASVGQLGRRGAIVVGAGLVAGPIVTLLGAQGGTRPETMPVWTRWVYVFAGLVGAAVGLSWLR